MFCNPIGQRLNAESSKSMSVAIVLREEELLGLDITTSAGSIVERPAIQFTPTSRRGKVHFLCQILLRLQSPLFVFVFSFLVSSELLICDFLSIDFSPF